MANDFFNGLGGLSRGVGVLGSLIGGRASSIAYSVERGGDILSERFNGMSPEWLKEHEQAFERAQNEAMQHFSPLPFLPQMGL